MAKVHLDTDLGGDIDDLCALAMLLRWPGVELTGITVVGDDRGRRSGYTRRALEIAGRADVPLAAGVDMADGYYPYPLGLPEEERYWREPVAPQPGSAEKAVELLKNSIDQGAILIAIGPLTNLYLLEQAYPGILACTELYIMGGYLHPIRPGFPGWGNEMDFNLQVDVRSAKYVIEHARPTLIPLTVTVETSLRRAYLELLRQSGGLGALIAHQAEEFARDEQYETRFGRIYPGLPDDLINFQHDSLACAVALGWRAGVTIEDIHIRVEERAGVLYERIDPAGRPARLVTQVDAARFSRFWLDMVTGETREVV